MVDNKNIDQLFADAVKSIQNSEKDSNLSNNDRLFFYAHFKQATIGKCNTPQPSMVKIVDRTKWNAWKSLGNMS